MTAISQETKELQDTVKCQQSVIMAQQRIIEELESKSRSSNLIVTGIPENKVPMVVVIETALDAIGVSIDRYDVKRLGQAATGKTRPILMTLTDPSARSTVLEKAKLLKDIGTKKVRDTDIDYSKVYIKKDMHSVFRREWNRLHSMVKREKGKIENQGSKIELNAKTRKLPVMV